MWFNQFITNTSGNTLSIIRISINNMSQIFQISHSYFVINIFFTFCILVIVAWFVLSYACVRMCVFFHVHVLIFIVRFSVFSKTALKVLFIVNHFCMSVIFDKLGLILWTFINIELIKWNVKWINVNACLRYWFIDIQWLT